MIILITTAWVLCATMTPPDPAPLSTDREDAGRLADAEQLDAGLLDAGQVPDAGKATPGDAALTPADAGQGGGAGKQDAGTADAGRLAEASPRDGGVAVSRVPGGEAAFLFFPEPPSAVDGTVLPSSDASGPRASMIKYAGQQEASRARELASAQRSLAAVTAALDTFFKTSGGEDPRVQRDELARLAGAVLEQGRMAYLAAADHERRRLAWVVKVVRDAEANEEENPLPGVDLGLLTARQTAVRDGRVRTAIDARIRGYRGLLMGIVAWVDGDTFLSLNQLKLAVEGVPDLPLAHLYLGYLHYILENLKPALAEWGKALELDPTNETIKKLIADHLHELKQK